MAKYAPDGGVVSSKLPVRERSSRDHVEMLGLYRGIVMRSVFPDEPESTSKSHMEYLVRVKGQVYRNAIDLRGSGGIYNYDERVFKGVEKSFTGQVKPGQFDENLDGEHVIVAFVEGRGDIPVIVAGLSHSRRKSKLKKADGLVEVSETNGVETRIDGAGNFTVTQVGLKDSNGKVLNPDAVGTQVKVSASGEVTIAAKGNVTVADKAGNSISMAAGGLTINAAGPVNVKSTGVAMIDAGGALTIKAKGDTSIQAEGAVTIKAKGNSLAGGLITDNAANNDPITGIPLNAVGGIKAQ